MTLSQSKSSTTVWLAAGVVLAAITAFLPIVRNHFIRWDDDLIAHSPDFAAGATFLDWGHYWTGPTNHLYMPLTYSFWGAISMIAQKPGEFGGRGSVSPEIFHAASLLLHAVNALLMFLLLRRVTTGSAWPAFFGALLFAVHPLQTESVAWVSETSVVLSGVFSLWAILEFLHFSDLARGRQSIDMPPGGALPAMAPALSKRRAWIHYALGTVALALALLSKPSAVAVPVIVLVIELVLRRRRWQEVIWPLSLWAAMSAPMAILTHHWQQPPFTFPIWQRPLIAGDALAFYLCKVLLPVGLSINYCRTPQWLFDHGAVAALSWLAPAALTILAGVFWRSARWVMAAVLLFIVPLLPVLGLSVFLFQKFSTPADRYIYLAMLGPALAVSALMKRLPRPKARVAAGAVMIVLIVLSIHRAFQWVDTMTLIAPVVREHPESHSAQESWRRHILIDRRNV